MADTQYLFLSDPGVRRDGTKLHSNFYADGVWVRWQRGLPRKIGGYRASAQNVNGPIRSVLVDSRNGITSAHYFSQWGIQRQQISDSGAGGALEDRTPPLFIPDPKLSWSHGIMHSSTGGSYAALIAAATPDVNDITSDVGGSVYAGNAGTSDSMAELSDANSIISVSGGICVLQPFLFLYGSSGLIRNSNANDFSAATGFTAGGTNFANSANVAGTKFVHGAPVRGGGQSPAGLFWSLDSLVRVSFVGGAKIWSYDTLSSPTSVLSKKAIVEHDGKFFWPGTDRFLFYAGTVQELPNDMNLNYFFDNLNFAQRNKVWGTKIQRWGEIWWFYPRGSATECTDAVIYNYRENTWYDAKLARSAGDKVQTFQYPVWAGPEDGQATTKLALGFTLSSTAQANAGQATVAFGVISGPFRADDIVNGMKVFGPGVPSGAFVVSHTSNSVVLSANFTNIAVVNSTFAFSSVNGAFVQGSTVTGAASGATGLVVKSTVTDINVINTTRAFLAAELLSSPNGANATLQRTPVPQRLDAVYQQEFGFDKVVKQDVQPIVSSFTSQSFGFAIGAPFGPTNKFVDVMTSMSQLDPDFNQIGPLTVYVEGASHANSQFNTLETQKINPGQPIQTLRAQERLLRLKIESNTQGGFFEQGQVTVTLDTGDERSSAV